MSDIVGRRVSSLPIQLSTRLLLDSISYTNPLPPWWDLPTINYEAREDRIGKTITKYLKGATPGKPFEIEVPRKKTESKKSWKVPSINDQIIAQVSVSALADIVHRTIDSNRIFSYRYNIDPNRLQLTESQVTAWQQFQNETKQRCKSSSDCLLQFDIEDTSKHIERTRFFAFLEERAPNRSEVSLLRVMLESFSGVDPGLPLVNDSIFFMTNAYLHNVDEIVRKYSSNFIRFVDDYRIFGQSRDHLESILEKVTEELARLGFKLNGSKVRLGSAEQYLEKVAAGKYAKIEQDSNAYVSATILGDVIEPDMLKNVITFAVSNPEDSLNEGYGRLTLGAIRRIRLNNAAVTAKGYKQSPLDAYQRLLSEDNDVLQTIFDLLQRYIPQADETWRTVWLLYVLDDVYPTRGDLQLRKRDLLHFASESGSTDLVRLWANRALASGESGYNRPQFDRNDLEELHELGYLEGGVRFYGSNWHS